MTLSNSLTTKNQGESLVSGTFRLKGSFLLEQAKSKGLQNLHQIHLNSRVSYQTIHKYMTKDELPSIDLKVLANLLFDGVKFTPEELSNMRFGDIFEYVEDE